jgi:hypothetical protein
VAVDRQKVGEAVLTLLVSAAKALAEWVRQRRATKRSDKRTKNADKNGGE